MKRLLRVVPSILVWGGISVAALADDPYNYAEGWKGWSLEAKSAYLWGLRDGGSNAYFLAARNWLPSAEWAIDARKRSARVQRVSKAVFLQLDAPALVPVMTDLYRDPANAFIEFREIAEAARDKLMGSDVQERLMRARKWAVENQKLQEQIKNK